MEEDEVSSPSSDSSAPARAAPSRDRPRILLKGRPPAKQIDRDTSPEDQQDSDAAPHITSPTSSPAPARPAVRLTTLNADDEIERIYSITKNVAFVELGDGRKVRVSKEDLGDYPDVLEEYERRMLQSDPIEVPSSDDERTVEADEASSAFGEEEEEEESDNVGRRSRRDTMDDFIADDDESDAGPRRGKRSRRSTRSVEADIEPTRRSSRSTRHQDGFINEAKAIEEASEEEDDEDDGSSSAEEPIRVARKPAAIIDLDEEEPSGSGEDEAEHPQHLHICAHCHDPPAKMKQKGKKARPSDFDDIRGQGAWITCGTCIFAFHYGCLPAETMKAVARKLKNNAMDVDGEVKKNRELDPTARFTLPKCPSCSKKALAGCQQSPCLAGSGDEEMNESRLFRCTNCARAYHFGCLSESHPRRADAENCDDCLQWGHRAVEAVLAWRIAGATEGDPVPDKWTLPSHKDFQAQAEYLIKFADSSYRHTEWLPHGFLATRFGSKLRNFLDRGSTVQLHAGREDGREDGEDGVDQMVSDDIEQEDDADRFDAFSQAPDPAAENRIPTEWQTIDRILDIQFENNARPSLSGEEKLPHIDRAIKMLVKWRLLPYKAKTWDDVPQEGDADYSAFVKAYAAWVRMRRVKLPSLSKTELAVLNKPRKIAEFVDIKEQPSYVGAKSGKLKDFQLEGMNWLFAQWWRKRNCILADEMGLGKTVQIIAYLSVLFRKENMQPFLIVVPNSTLANWVRELEAWAPKDMVVCPFYGDSDSRKTITDYEMFYGDRLRAHCVVTTFETIMNHSRDLSNVQRWETLVVDEGQRLKAGQGGKLFRVLKQLNIGHKVILSGTPLNNSVSELLNLFSFLDPEQYHGAELEDLKAHFAEIDADKVKEVQGMLRQHMLRRTKEQVLDLPSLNIMSIPLSLRPLQKKVYRDILARNVESISTLFQDTSAKRKPSKRNHSNILMELRKTACHPFLVASELEPRGNSDVANHEALVDASSKLRFLQLMLPKLKARGHRVLIFSQFVIVLDVLERFMKGEKLKFERLDGNTAYADRQRGIDAFNKEGSDLFAYLLTTRAGGVGINLTSADTVILFDHDWNPQQDLQAIARAHRIGQKRPVTCYKLFIEKSCEEKLLATAKRKLALEHLVVQSINNEDGDDEPLNVQSLLEYGAKDIYEQADSNVESANDKRYTAADIDKLLDRSEAEIEERTGQRADQAKENVLGFARVWEVSKDTMTEVDDTEDAVDVEEQRGFWARVIAEQEAKAALDKQERDDNLGRGRRQAKQLTTLNFDVSDNLFEDDPDSPGKSVNGKRKASDSDSDDEDFEQSEDEKQNAEHDELDAEMDLGVSKEARDLQDGPIRSKPKQPKRPKLAAPTSRGFTSAPPWMQNSLAPSSHLPAFSPPHNMLPHGRPMPGPSSHAAAAAAAAQARQHSAHGLLGGPLLTQDHNAGQSQDSKSQAQRRRDNIIRQLSAKAEKLKNAEISALLRDAVLRSGKEQTRMLLHVTAKLRAGFGEGPPAS